MRPVERFDELARELDALRLAARERRRRLAERDVAEADVGERLERAARSCGWFVKSSSASSTVRSSTSAIERLLYFTCERRVVEALALAHLAGHVDVGQEVHLDALDAVALARLAAPALHVEREAARACSRASRASGSIGEEVADRGRTAWCRWPGWSAACARSGSGRCRSPCRSARGPSIRACAPTRRVAAVQRARERRVEDRRSRACSCPRPRRR